MNKEQFSEKERQILIKGIRHVTALSHPNVTKCVDSIQQQFSELRKQSEPETNVCEAGKELVEKIELILNENRETDRFNRTALDWRNFHSVATEIAALLQPKTKEPEANVSEAMENVSKQAIIARLKRIGFTRMDEPNHYANDLGLSFAFDQNSKYSIANSNGYILISTDDVFDAFKLLQPDNELLEALKKICRVAPSYIKNPDDELDNAICEAMLAVYNYEKQGK